MTMRSWMLAGLLTVLAVPALGQDQAKLKQNRDEKLQSDFLKKANWITDFDQAKAAAKKEGKPIFAYFTRSYAG